MVLRHATQVLPCLSLSKRSNSVLLKSYKSRLVPYAIRISSGCATRFSYRALDFVIMQGRQRKVPKSVLHVRNLMLRLSNPLFFDLLVAVVVAKAVGTHVNEIETMQT